MSEVPVWIQVLQALLAPTIALGIGVIAFMQWRTAHQKVVLDLFERRTAVYDTLEKAAALIEISLCADALAVSLAREGFLRAKFLFGADAFSRINNFYSAVASFEQIPPEVALYDSESERREIMRRRNAQAMSVVTNFRKEMPNIFESYMRMDQRRVRTPAEWLADRNRIRLSYADEKHR
jgi:hypothetical protein